MKGAGRVITEDLKKHDQDLRLAVWNQQNREKLKAQKSESKLSQYYGFGAVMAVEILGFLGYCIY